MIASKAVVSFFFVVMFFSFLSIDTIIVAAPKELWCERKTESGGKQWEEKYDKDYTSADGHIRKGACSPDNDTGVFDDDDYNSGSGENAAHYAVDGSEDDDYADANVGGVLGLQLSGEIAICHSSTYDGVDGFWIQIYVDYTGYDKAFWCEDKGSSHKNKLEKKNKIDTKVSEAGGDSHIGLCDENDSNIDNPDITVYCEYKDDKYKSKDEDTLNLAENKVESKPGSHLGGWTTHERHTYDYYGFCTGSTVGSGGITHPAVAPAPEAPTLPKRIGASRRIR